MNTRLATRADNEVTAEDLSYYNLVLIGRAADNALVARMADKLPAAINEDNELVAGGREPVSLANAWLGLTYYNPLDPQRLIYWLRFDPHGPNALERFGNVAEALIGMGSVTPATEPDLIVMGFGGPPRRCMQFTHDWAWRDTPGADLRIAADLQAGPTGQCVQVRMRRGLRADAHRRPGQAGVVAAGRHDPEGHGH